MKVEVLFIVLLILIIIAFVWPTIRELLKFLIGIVALLIGAIIVLLLYVLWGIIEDES